MKNFKEAVQLHVHSLYSNLDAIPSPQDWLNFCLANKIPGISITDHGTAVSLYDAVRYRQLIKEYNKENNTTLPDDAAIMIPGIELYVKMNKEDTKHFHINVWATSNEGYYNLMKLGSMAYDDVVSIYGRAIPRITLDDIQQHRQGIKIGTACIASPMGKAVMNGELILAEDIYKKYIEMFGEDLYVEFHASNLTNNFNAKTGLFDPIGPNPYNKSLDHYNGYNNWLLDMVEKHGGKPIPVTDAHFISKEDKIYQDILLKGNSDNGWYFDESYHYKNSQEMFTIIKDQLGDRLTDDMFDSWIENTYEVMNLAKSINITFDYHLPKIEIPENIQKKTSDYKEQTLYLLMKKIKQHGRWSDDPVYVDRFKKEIDVIMDNEKLNFIPYFLMYEDICSYARSNGMLQNIGRGSAGGSLVSYYLKIIHIDPIANDLPFERFLSHARIRAGSFPDIDLDLADREEIVSYLKTKYGVGFAQIATYQKLKTKNAIKDTMWAIYGKMGTDPEVHAICKTIPDSPSGVDEYDFLYGYTDQEGTYNEGLMETNKDLVNFFKRYPDVQKFVNKLIGIPRGFGRHASAFVISTLDLSAQRVPTMKIKGHLVTQYDGAKVEKSGLVKADILVVKTLSSVAKCIDLVKKELNIDLLEEDDKGVALIYRLPEDKGVYDDFYHARTDSSFQFNTSLIKGGCKEFAPKSQEDLSSFTALYRPGAMDAPFEDTTATKYYVDVKNGRRPLRFLHNDLAPILKNSNGIMQYQEDVMKILVEIIGYTWEEADQIRGAISKKKHDVIMSTFDRIRKATEARGWSKEQSETLCQQVQAFSKYSFNRSHSTAYARLGYITMYLKHHYELHWWASVLNTDKDDEDKLRKHVEFLGSIIVPPSLRYTSEYFTVVDGKIISPLGVIKRVGASAIKDICVKGPFKDIEDFVDRVEHRLVNSGVFAALIKSRAVDCFMDQNVDYYTAKMQIMEKYIELKKLRAKSKTQKISLPDELYSKDALQVYLMEKDINACFNKELLSDEAVLQYLPQRWKGLKPTGKKGVPFTFAGIPVLSGVNVAKGLLDKEYKKEVAMVMLYDGSTIKSGVSKKGKEYSFIRYDLSDGFNKISVVKWDVTKPINWGINSIVYVSGILKYDFRNEVTLELTNIEQIK